VVTLSGTEKETGPATAFIAATASEMVACIGAAGIREKVV
jgi:hypothetical protein